MSIQGQPRLYSRTIIEERKGKWKKGRKGGRREVTVDFI
jgi:hypothetical protein